MLDSDFESFCLLLREEEKSRFIERDDSEFVEEMSGNRSTGRHACDHDRAVELDTAGLSSVRLLQYDTSRQRMGIADPKVRVNRYSLKDVHYGRSPKCVSAAH